MSDELRRKVASLLRMAQNEKASEAEAMAAAERAAKLMAEAGLSATDIEFDEEQATLRTRRASIRDTLWGVIAHCTNCGAITRRDWTPVVIFIGRAPGPQIAVYLVDVLNRAIDREIELFKLTPEYRRRRTLATRRAAVQDFVNGLVGRLRLRIMGLFQASIDLDAAEEAQAVRDQRFPSSAPHRVKAHSVRFGGAAAAGYSAGGRVQIAHGVTGGHAPRQIGGCYEQASS